MAPVDLLVVGPESRTTGGITRYVTEQCRRLPAEVDARVYDLGTPALRGPWQSLVAVLASLRDAAAFPLRRRPDVVHVHTSHGYSFYRAAWYVLVAAYLWRRPVVLHVHGSSFEEFVAADSPVRGRVQSLVFGASDAVIVLSEHWRDVLGPHVSDGKLEVVPNAVDVSEYSASFEADPPHVAFVSNHVRRKGIVEFVEAVDRLQQDGPAFHVSIAGDGPLSHHAEALAERHPGVDYLGYVSEAEKRALLGRASIYVLPTYAEGLPIALLEGMAGGNAVVSTAVGSIPEVVGEDNGRLVRPGDTDGLTDTLRELVAAPETVRAMAERNRALVAEAYSWSTTSERLVDVYRSVLGGRDERVPEA